MRSTAMCTKSKFLCGILFHTLDKSQTCTTENFKLSVQNTLNFLKVAFARRKKDQRQILVTSKF